MKICRQFKNIGIHNGDAIHYSQNFCPSLSISMNINTFIPDAFIEDVKSYIPDHLKIEDFIATCQTPLKRAVRVNTLKMSTKEFEQECAQRNWQITPVPWCQQVVGTSRAGGSSPAIRENRFTPQWLYLCARSKFNVATDGTQRRPNACRHSSRYGCRPR